MVRELIVEFRAVVGIIGAAVFAVDVVATELNSQSVEARLVGWMESLVPISRLMRTSVICRL